MMGAALYRKDARTKKEIFLGQMGRSSILGRSPQADIQLADIKCAGIHALIERTTDGRNFELIDLGSHFGTFRLGKRIQASTIGFGEPFVIGNHQLILRPTLAEDYFNPKDPNFLRQRHSDREKSFTQIIRPEEKTQLEVSLYWGDQLLDVRTFRPGSVITVGSQMNATFGVTLAQNDLQKHPYAIARYKGSDLHLALPTEATGLVWRGSDILSIDTLRHKDTSQTEFGALNLVVARGDRADVQIGELTLSFNFVIPAKKVKEPIFPQFDKTFSRVMSAVVAIYFLLFLFMSYTPVPLETVTMKDLPKHLKQVVVDAGIDEALKRQQAAIGQLMPELSGGRARGEEGKVSAKKDMKKAEAPVEKTKPNPQKNTKSQLKATPQDNPNIDFDSAFSSPSKSKALDVASVTGRPQEGNSAAAIAGSGFARGTKGLGAGGGGRSVGIGQLTGNQTGGGLGAGDYGLAPSKGKEITVEDMEEIVILGGLDPEIIAQYIRRYLAQIRNCYEQQLSLNPDLKGKVTVKFIIGATGSVQDAKVVESSLGNPKAEQCIERRILDWKFPKPKGGSKVGVKYPFLLMSNTEK